MEREGHYEWVVYQSARERGKAQYTRAEVKTDGVLGDGASPDTLSGLRGMGLVASRGPRSTGAGGYPGGQINFVPDYAPVTFIFIEILHPNGRSYFSIGDFVVPLESFFLLVCSALLSPKLARTDKGSVRLRLWDDICRGKWEEGWRRKEKEECWYVRRMEGGWSEGKVKEGVKGGCVLEEMKNKGCNRRYGVTGKDTARIRR